MYICYERSPFDLDWLEHLFITVKRAFKQETYAYLYGNYNATQIVEDAEQMLLMGAFPEEVL